MNGCEYEILNGRLLVIIGNDVSLGRSDAFSELPENTIVVPYGELTGSFEIIITTDPDLVVTFRELTAQEPEDRTLTLNQQIEVLGLKFAVKEKNEVWQYSLPGIIENNIISTKQHFFSSKLFKYVMLFFLFAIINIIPIIAPSKKAISEIIIIVLHPKNKPSPPMSLTSPKPIASLPAINPPTNVINRKIPAPTIIPNNMSIAMFIFITPSTNV